MGFLCRCQWPGRISNHPAFPVSVVALSDRAATIAPAIAAADPGFTSGVAVTGIDWLGVDMPSSEHESPIALANLEPGLVAWLLATVFEVNVGEYHHARTHPTEVRVLVPHTYNCDSMLLFCDDSDRPLFAVVLEVQRRWDESKLRTWKLYLAQVEVELDVSAALVVYCEKSGTACRYRERLSSERLSLPLRPFIFTPEDVPVAVDSETARRNPAVVVLSALCHGRRPGVDGLFPVLAEALQAAGPDKALLLYDVVLAGLPAPARARWETFMTTTENYEYHSELFRTLAAAARAEGEAEGEARGEARGEAEAVLIVLEGRGMGVPDEVRDRILACTDLEQLRAWLRRAVTAETIEDVITD